MMRQGCGSPCAWDKLYLHALNPASQPVRAGLSPTQNLWLFFGSPTLVEQNHIPVRKNFTAFSAFRPMREGCLPMQNLWLFFESPARGIVHISVYQSFTHFLLPGWARTAVRSPAQNLLPFFEGSTQWARLYPHAQKLHCISCFPAGGALLSSTQNLWLFFGSLHASGKALSSCVKNTLSFLLPNRCTRIVPTRNLRPFFEGRRARARRGHLNDAEGRSYRYGHKGISLLRPSLSTNNRITLFSTNFPAFQTEFVLWQ